MSNQNTSNWTDERVAILKRLWMEGLSATKIAQRLGHTSRNAVIGKVHRLDMPMRATSQRFSRFEVASSRRKASRSRETLNKMTPVKSSAMFGQAKGPRLIVEPIPVETDKPEKLVSLAEWPDANCKWPYSTEKSIAFGCTCKRADGLPYCAGHAARAYTAPQPITMKPRANGLVRMIEREHA